MTNALSLSTALKGLARSFDLDYQALVDYAAEDPHGGYHAAYDDGFPSGSLWRVEGQVLYALVRALKPLRVLELGTWHGASATHILQGLKDNDYGWLWSVDSRAYGDIEIGGMIPGDLRGYANIHAARLETFIDMAINLDTRYDLIFEDAMHTVEQVEFVWSHADQLLRPGGMIISHDAMHPIAGPVVREGIVRAGYADKTVNVLIEPSDCGLALWRKPL